MILDTISWYLAVALVGLLAYPLAFRFLRFLPDRGYTLIRPLGLLIWGYAFWLLASLGVLPNNLYGVLFALFLLGGLSFWAMRGVRWSEMADLLKSQKRLILISEGLLLVGYVAWTIIRAYVPDVNGTEKPMELAFINSILRSPSFPPSDPWLSGYAISYYYFGYVILSMLIRVSGVASSIAFNLTVAMWFGLTALAAFGILYNLIRVLNARLKCNVSALVWGLLAPFFLLIVSNVEGFLEILYARGLFWTRGVDGQLTSSFWSWLAIKELDVPPAEPFGWALHRSGILWWRGSRVIQDYDALNNTWEVIDEFPFFSYLLGDLHPHFLVMPFALLVIGLIFNLFLKGHQEAVRSRPLKELAKDAEFWLSAVLLGAMGFLNTWDFPIYVMLFSAVYTLLRWMQLGWSRDRIWDFLKCGLLFGIAGFVLYLPFYVGFSSQAGGLLPSMVFMTHGINFWVMFAPLLIPIFAWLIYLWRQQGNSRFLKLGFWVAGGIVFGLWLLSFLYGGLGASLASIGRSLGGESGGSAFSQRLISLGTLFLNQQGAASAVDLISTAMLRRITDPGTWLTLLILIGLVWGLVHQSAQQRANVLPVVSEVKVTLKVPDESVMALLLVLLGAGLTLFPEFLYLRDNFGTRMNNIFKFYFTTWILWSIAAAYGSVILWTKLHGAKKAVYGIVWGIVIAMALCYPVIMLLDRTNSFKSTELTLDGNAYIQKFMPDEMEAMRWLSHQPPGVIAEAVGNSYQSEFARFSTRVGYPTVIGWIGHELQWRGGGTLLGSRSEDIARLYQTSDWQETLAVIQQYKIRYVILGNQERITYKVDESKFMANCADVFHNTTVTIYEVPQFSTVSLGSGQ